MAASSVLFDLGHVVLDWRPLRLYTQIFADPAEAEHFCAEICTMEWHTRHDAGASMADNAAPLIARYPHYESAIRAWRTRWLDMFEGYVPGVPALIARLEERRTPLYGLSNLPAEVAQETFDAFPIVKLLRDVVVSGEEKVIKPDPEIYRIALARMGAPEPSSVLFVDDRPDNTAAAQALGFHVHTFTRADLLERTLNDHKLL